MRRLILSLLGVSSLAIFAGCHTCSPGCNTGLGGHSRSTSHGVCDCEVDDHCSSLTPWVRLAPPVVLGAPVAAVPAPHAKALPKPDLE